MSDWIDIKYKVPKNDRPILMAIRKISIKDIHLCKTIRRITPILKEVQTQTGKDIYVGLGYKTKSKDIPIQMLTGDNDFYWVSCLPVFCDKPKSKLHFMSDPFFITQNDKQQDPWWKIIAWQYLPKLENWPCKNLIKNNRFNLIDIE